MKQLYVGWLGVALVLCGIARPPHLYAQSDAVKHALELEQSGQLPEAETAWRAVVVQDPHNAAAFAQLGQVQSRETHYADAAASYQKALALNPGMPGVEMNLGIVLFKAGDFRASIKPFTAELTKHPGDERLMILLGMAHYGMGDYLVAIPYLRYAAKKDTTSLPLRLALAHSCMWSKQYQCVLDVYKEILAINPDSAEADMLAGEALDQKGDSAGAIAQFRAAIRSNPKEPNAHFGLGYLLWTQSHYPEAAKEFQAELENDPHHVQALAYLGDCYVHANEYDKARPELEKAVAADPGLEIAHRDLGIVYINQGRNEDAIRELSKASELDPSDVAPHWRLAKLYQAMGRKAEAAQEFKKASTLVNKDNNQTLYEKLEAKTKPTQ